ncbi:MAG: hypothetical protein PHH48_08395 [Eubacteriales bacterium]|nr:hypothetical protein [Eubacteriales bacterium]
MEIIQIEIDGEMEEVQLFDSMFGYLDYYGSDISTYMLHMIADENYIVNGFRPEEDGNFYINGEYEYDGKSYTRINWGEIEICFIPSNQVSKELFTIYVKEDENVYHNYKSMIFETEEEAQQRADKLNAEEEN